MKSYIVTLEGEDGDILPLPDELMAELGWKVGDTIEFEDLGNGSFSISKKDVNPEPSK
jgi:hypothetical protein